MPNDVHTRKDGPAGAAQLEHLTRRQLRELEEKEKTPLERGLELLILVLPLVCGGAALLEYWYVPNHSANKAPLSYVAVLLCFMAAYLAWGCFAAVRRRQGDKSCYERVRYRAPLFSGLFLLLLVYDVLTLKTGILTQPFVPCMNLVINAFLHEYAMLFDCTVNTLKATARVCCWGWSPGSPAGIPGGYATGWTRSSSFWAPSPPPPGFPSPWSSPPPSSPGRCSSSGWAPGSR